MSGDAKKMGLALVCADGRLHQEAVHYNDQLAKEMGVDLVDIVAVPGPDGLCKVGHEAEHEVTMGWLNLLIQAHHPTAVAVVGHYQCAGNPTSDEEHDADAAACARIFKSELDFSGEVFAFSTIWHADNNWSLKKIEIPEAVVSPIQVAAPEV